MPRLSQHILLTHEYHKHKEPTQEVEAVGDSEEDLELGEGLVTGHAPMVAVEKIVEAREDPKDAKNGEQFTKENLNKNIITVLTLQQSQHNLILSRA